MMTGRIMVFNRRLDTMASSVCRDIKLASELFNER